MTTSNRGEESVKHIVAYLEKNLAKGYKLEGLKWALVNQKYSKIEIDKAVKIIEARRPVEKISEEIKVEDSGEKEISHEQVDIPKERGFFKRLFGRD